MTQERIDKLRKLGQGLSEHEFSAVVSGYLQSKGVGSQYRHDITETVNNTIKHNVDFLKTASAKVRGDLAMPF